MATRIGIELSPTACRIVEVEAGAAWRRNARETRVVSYAILPPSGPETQAKLDVSTFGGYAHDALFMVVDAIKRAGGTDKQKVRDAIEATHGFVGVSGIYNMSPTDHMGLDVSAFRMVEVQGGAFKEVR